ncbi:MAG: glycoside hydrolase family 2 protein, partial [Promethearchaeota archaeon]
SWSSLDYYCRWKALHYVVKRAYQPVAASVEEYDDNVNFWIVNDGKVEIKCALNWWLVNEEGKIIKEKKLTDLSIPPYMSRKVDDIGLDDLPNERNRTFRNKIAFYKLYKEDGTKKLVHEGFRFIGNPKNFTFKDPEIMMTMQKIEKNELPDAMSYKVSVKVKNVALYLFIESDKVDFIASDNFFSLMPGETKKLVINIKNILPDLHETSESEIDERAFQIRSLFDLC